MTVRLLYRRPRRRADMGEHQAGADMRRQLPEVAVVPRGLDALEDRRRLLLAVPGDAEPVAVRRLDPEPRVEALVDQRVCRLVEQLLQGDRRARVCEPAA